MVEIMRYLPMLLAFVLMLMGIPVPICLLGGSFLYFGVLNTTLPMTSVIQNLVSQCMSTGMLAAPFFILAGAIMNYSGITGKLLVFCDKLIGHKKGGLAYVNVLLSTVNGGMTGSATADAAMDCKILVPEMEKLGYPRAFATVVSAASSLITPIIPPGVPLILYGIMTGVSVGKMWAAGYIPGLLLCVAEMVVVYCYAKKNNWKSDRNKRASLKEILQSLKECIWAMFIPLFMILGLRGGAFTATEGGTVIIAMVLIMGIFIYHTLKPEHIKPVLQESFVGTANIMLVIVSAMTFSMYLSWERIPQDLAEMLMNVSANKWVFMLLANVLIFVMGMFLDGTALLLILTPILYPIAQQYGIDLIVFGLVMLVNLYCGCLTPPFGTIMYITCNMTKVSIPEFCKYSWGFILAMLAVMLVMAFFPGIVTFLPNLLYGA